jgi:hypothetical protein
MPLFYSIVFVTDVPMYTDGDVDMLVQEWCLIYDEDPLVDPGTSWQL